MAAEKNKYQNSKYFKQVVEIFDDFPDDNSKRAYCSALIACFSPKDGSPESPQKICAAHGFPHSKPKDYRFVLAKKHAIQFFVTDCSWPSVSSADIRSVKWSSYVDLFGREPYVRGRSKYWLTIGEWIVLLNAPGEAPLPDKIKEFAEAESLL